MSCIHRSATVAGVFLAALCLLAFAAGASDPALARAVGDRDLEWGPCPALFPAGCRIAVLHGDPAQPNSDVFFRVPGEYDLPSHFHSSAERMILVAGELELTYAGQEPAALETGTYAYGPPKAVHWGRCVSSEACVLFIAFEQPVDATEVARESK